MTTSPTILITGATNGPGRALAHHYAAADAALILHGRHRFPLKTGGSRADQQMES
jgi:short-subunit dehydrogenase